MKYFIDTEFSERGPKYPVELISIGIVAQDEREFYGVNADFNQRHANEWVKDNVLPLLPVQRPDYHDSPRLHSEAEAWCRRAVMGQRIIDFIGDDLSPEFWGYYSGYDWVVFCQIFGDMGDLPTGWPMYCHDLRQALDDRDLGRVTQDDDAPHNALQDARWVADTYRGYIGGIYAHH